jgi:hypothetical protein
VVPRRDEYIEAEEGMFFYIGKPGGTRGRPRAAVGV